MIYSKPAKNILDRDILRKNTTCFLRSLHSLLNLGTIYESPHDAIVVVWEILELKGDLSTSIVII